MRRRVSSAIAIARDRERARSSSDAAQAVDEPAVLEQHEGVGRGRAEDRRVLAEVLVDHERRRPPRPGPHHDGAAPGGRLGRRRGRARLVRPGRALGRAQEQDPQGRVVERLAEPAAQLERRRLRADAEREALDGPRRMGLAGDEAGREGQGDERQGQEVQPPGDGEARALGVDGPDQVVAGQRRDAVGRQEDDGHQRDAQERPAAARPPDEHDGDREEEEHGQDLPQRAHDAVDDGRLRGGDLEGVGRAVGVARRRPGRRHRVARRPPARWGRRGRGSGARRAAVRRRAAGVPRRPDGNASRRKTMLGSTSQATTRPTL